MSLFYGPDCDEINKTSISFGSRIHSFKSMTKTRKSSRIVCDCDALLKCHENFVMDHHISCSALPLGYTITCDQQWDIFLLSSLSNEKLFNYKVIDLVASYNFRIYFFFSIWGHLKILKIWNSKFKLYIWVSKQRQLKKFWTTKL